jgi:hypothetical protein
MPGIMLAISGEQSVMQTMTGVYRPPLGNLGAALDQAVWHPVGQATIRAFISRVAEAIAQPGTAIGSPGADRPASARGVVRGAVSWLSLTVPEGADRLGRCRRTRGHGSR